MKTESVVKAGSVLIVKIEKLKIEKLVREQVRKIRKKMRIMKMKGDVKIGLTLEGMEIGKLISEEDVKTGSVKMKEDFRTGSVTRQDVVKTGSMRTEGGEKTEIVMKEEEKKGGSVEQDVSLSNIANDLLSC